MSQCCGDGKKSEPEACEAAKTSCCSGDSPEAGAADTPCAWFGRMIHNCLKYATEAKAAGRPVVGILCEYTPRELIMAAGGVPVCLCGGSSKTIPPAEEHLPANLCPLIKSTFGYHVQRSNPFLEMADLVVAETTCDGKKKMYELLGESRPMYVLELPQKAGDPDAMQHWLRELEKFREFLADRFETEVTDDKIRQAVGVMNRERALRRELAGFMRQDCPPWLGRQLIELKSSISGIPADFEQYEKAIGLLAGKEPDGNMASRVRVLMT
ncbi:MAG TPA: 2-hydroxyacyl-CoA dehydratase family protein, partial [Phycisphaerae bacterium]|nr:2-hydroxyacyl-CoA dehydratase family protein [Phycisphaerae bacterium]